MADFNDLATFMDRIVVPVETLAKQKAAEAALSILADVINVTPADTGKAISNWQLTLDAPAASILPPYVPSPKGRVHKGVWEHAADPATTKILNAHPALELGLQTLNSKRPGQPIFITNNTEYIQELNSGSSKQAPAGYIDRAIIVAENIVGRARII